MDRASPQPIRRRRRAARALAWALAAGAWGLAASAWAMAPEAAAGSEVAPPADEASAEGPADASTSEAPATAPVVAPSDAPPPDEAPATAPVVAPPPVGAASPPPRGATLPSDHREAPARDESRLSRYLQRPVRFGAHFVDHGVLQAAVAGGWPHRYRVELSLGLLDHLTLGATAHWLPGQARPQVSPVVAIAILRGRLAEFGVWHFWSLFPPPRDDLDPATPSYQRRAQWLLATASFGQAWLTGGLDAGVVRARVNDPGQDPAPDSTNPFVTRWRFGGGLHLRAGTRRWGLTAQVLVPDATAELRFDLRFGLFEKRSKGDWKPYGKPEDWDRGLPW